MATPIGKIINRNRMTGMEQPSQISFPATEMGGSVKYSTSIANPFRTDTVNQTDPTIKPTTNQFNQSNIAGHSDRKHSLSGSLDSSTGVPRYGRNIDNRTGTNSQAVIVTTIP